MAMTGPETAREILTEGRRTLILTGAGISAESGVPTFRGPDGLWKSFRPEELATPEAFARDPRLVWEWYGWRMQTVRRCEPNAGHLACARFALRKAAEGSSATIVTQNVDGLHARAAELAAAESVPPAQAAPAMPVELHGTLLRVRCSGCGATRPSHAPIDASSTATLPRCMRCGALERPAVVWFGERLPAAALRRAMAEARQAGACLVVGTSALVHPAAGVALAAVEAGAALIEVNTEATELTRLATVSVRGRAGEVLGGLLGE